MNLALHEIYKTIILGLCGALGACYEKKIILVIVSTFYKSLMLCAVAHNGVIDNSVSCLKLVMGGVD